MYPALFLSSSPLPDYLWGIETRINLSLKLYYFASRLPMRNWNWPQDKYFAWKEKASRLPMRNWNTNLRVIHKDAVIASRLPMRNWNSRLPQNPCLLSRFQTTYEELKPAFPHHVEERSRFQTTYEELKHDALRAAERFIESFQTTYEELKPSWIVPIVRPSCFQNTYKEFRLLLSEHRYLYYSPRC